MDHIQKTETASRTLIQLPILLPSDVRLVGERIALLHESVAMEKEQHHATFGSNLQFSKTIPSGNPGRGSRELPHQVISDASSKEATPSDPEDSGDTLPFALTLSS